MSINPIIQLAKAVGDIDKTQLAISDLERRMDESLLGKSNEDQTALRLELSKLKALLGELRNSEAYWRQEVAQNNQDRKGQGELAKG